LKWVACDGIYAVVTLCNALVSVSTYLAPQAYIRSIEQVENRK